MGALDHATPESIELTIESLAGGGRGVGRHGGVVWFVPGAVPGDRVLARPLRRRSRFVEAALVQLVERSPLRRPPPCPIQERCGGCPWMALGEREQSEFKRRLVTEALRRIGGLEGVEVEPLRSAAATLGYRSKVEFTLGQDGAGERVVGLHSSGSPRELVDVTRCAVQHEAANSVLDSARRLLLDRRGPWAAAFEACGFEPFRLVLRRSSLTGEILVALRETTAPFPDAASLARRLMAAHPEVVGVVRLAARRGRRGGTRTLAVAGRRSLDERVGGITFRLPAASFLQVHPEMGSLLVDLVLESAGPVGGAEVLDLYAGVGAFGLELARRGARVTLCEADRAAIVAGRQAARRHELGGVGFAQGDVGALLESRRAGGLGADLIVANPPRTGLGRGVVAAILAQRPRRVVLVSCDPATLARDAHGLVAGGLHIERVVPLDMFPQTAHVETVMCLS